MARFQIVNPTRVQSSIQFNMAHGEYCHSPASQVIAQALANQVNHGDIECIIQSQKHVLRSLEKTNEMLNTCNALSETRFVVANKELQRHTKLLLELKKDLDSVFKRIRLLKGKLTQRYPAAFSACDNIFNVLDEEEEPEERNPLKTRTDLLQGSNHEGRLRNVPGNVDSPSSPHSSATSYNSDDS